MKRESCFGDDVCCLLCCLRKNLPPIQTDGIENFTGIAWPVVHSERAGLSNHGKRLKRKRGKRAEVREGVSCRFKGEEFFGDISNRHQREELSLVSPRAG